MSSMFGMLDWERKDPLTAETVGGVIEMEFDMEIVA